MSSENATRRQILQEYLRAYEASREAPFLHTRQHLAERLGRSYEELVPHVSFLEQNRYLHWKATDIFKISPKGLRAARSEEDLAREFPD
jgi:hypothetical protein